MEPFDLFWRRFGDGALRPLEEGSERIEHVGFTVEQRAEESHPPLADMPYYVAAVSLPRHGRTVIRPSLSPPAAPI